MTEHATLSWLALIGLGAFHGINPGMGWLFAVALGMQERRRAAVYAALVPLAFGHALAVAAAILLAVVVGALVPAAILRVSIAGLLIALGISRISRHRHPRWVGMKVGLTGLTLWSFLMASAHGAGLMVAPLFLKIAMAADEHMHHAMPSNSASTAMLATGAHALGYLLVTAIVAALVFEKLGVRLLRQAWFNIDRVWAISLVVTGALTLAL